MELKIAFSNEENMTKLILMSRLSAPVILKEKRHFELCWRMKEKALGWSSRVEVISGGPRGNQKNTAQMRHICTLSGIEVRITWHKPPARNNSHNRGQKHKHRQGQPPLIPISSLWTSAPPPCVRCSSTPQVPRSHMYLRSIAIHSPPQAKAKSLLTPACSLISSPGQSTKRSRRQDPSPRRLGP